MKFRLDDAACDNLRSMLGTDDEPTRVVLFVGELQDEDGTPIYGLHAYEAEYPEEGAVTLAECPPPASGVLGTPQPDEWAEVERVRDLPEVDEALLNFKDDCTGDNAAMVVRAVMRAARGVRVGGEGQQQEPKCNPHPDAPHGFNRNASHNAGRYVCDCEGWEPDGTGDTQK